jgi:hypothetical protein
LWDPSFQSSEVISQWYLSPLESTGRKDVNCLSFLLGPLIYTCMYVCTGPLWRALHCVSFDALYAISRIERYGVTDTVPRKVKWAFKSSRDAPYVSFLTKYLGYAATDIRRCLALRPPRQIARGRECSVCRAKVIHFQASAPSSHWHSQYLTK